MEGLKGKSQSSDLEENHVSLLTAFRLVLATSFFAERWIVLLPK